MHKNATQMLIDVVTGRTVRTILGAWGGDALLTDRQWDDLVRTASDEGLAPLLYSRLRETNVLAVLPEDIRALLRNSYARTSAVNQHILAVLEDLEEALEQRDVPVIVLKGAALLNTVYHDIGLRPMDDIDLMIQPRHWDDMGNILTDMGFTRDRVYPQSYQRGIITIDLHTDVLSSERIHSRKDVLTIREDDIWRNAVSFNELSSSLHRLSSYDGLIALSFHLLKHRFNRLIWLIDISTFITAHAAEIEWMELVAYSRSLGADRLLLYALVLTNHLAGATIPDHVLIHFGKGELSFIEKYILRLHAARTPLETITDVLWIFQIRGIKKRIRFVKENIFPRREIMDQIVPSSFHGIGAFGLRSMLLFRMVLSDLLSSVMHALREGMPPL